MSLFSVVPVQFSEWGWLFGFAVVSLALVALAVLADALYQGYREEMRQHQEAAAHRRDHSELAEKRKKAA